MCNKKNDSCFVIRFQTKGEVFLQIFDIKRKTVTRQENTTLKPIPSDNKTQWSKQWPLFRRLHTSASFSGGKTILVQTVFVNAFSRLTTSCKKTHLMSIFWKNSWDMIWVDFSAGPQDSLKKRSKNTSPNKKHNFTFANSDWRWWYLITPECLLAVC